MDYRLILYLKKSACPIHNPFKHLCIYLYNKTRHSYILYPIANQTAGPNGIKFFFFFSTGNAGPFMASYILYDLAKEEHVYIGSNL